MVPSNESVHKEYAASQRPKRFKPLAVGTRKDGVLRAVANLPPRVYVPSHTLFVSRLHPDTTACEIADVVSSGDIKDSIIQKVKSKYDSYALFHIRVDECVAASLLSPERWPEDVVYKMFYGKLFEECVIEVVHRGHY